MRRLTLLWLVVIFILFYFPVKGSIFSKTDTIWIKTSAQCEMCKETIEKALAYERGVISSELDLKTKHVMVVYNSSKTTPEKIRKAISLVGYDADDVLADSKAYHWLPRCCKKPQDR